MAKLAELYYWTGDNPNHNITDQWKRAETAQSGNALNYVEFTHELGNPAEAYITLLNPVPNPFSGTLDKKTGPLNILTASEDDGTASAVFADLQRVYLRDPETKIILLAGRIYDIENDFNKMQGHTVNLRVKDELEMLRGVYTKDLNEFSITGGSTKRSDVIKTSLIGNAAFNTPAALGLSNKVDTSDSNRFNDSLRTYPTNYVGAIDSKKSNSNLLGMIAELAQEDPNDSTSTTIADNFGYDYYIDHNFQSVDNSGADTTTPPTPHLNYFPRGTRPNSNVSSFGLTVEFPTTGTFAETGQKVAMLDDFDFERPKNEIFTDCTLDGIKNKEGEFTKNFEVINVSSISGTFTWSEKEFSKEIDRTLADGSVVEFLDEYTADGSTKNHDNVARVQYQSKTSGGGYLLISDLSADFPTGTTQVQLRGASSGTTCLFTPSTDRPREQLGVKRTFRTKYGLETDVDNIRKKIAGKLSRSGASGTDILRGSFAFPRMPYFFKDVTPTSSSSTVCNMSINPESFGFEKGMTIGTLDSSSNIEHFSYASNTSSSSVTTTGISDTSGSAGTFSGSTTARFFVPVRAGDMIYVSNPTESVTSNMLVTKLEFRQGAGLGHSTRVEVVGKDAAVGGKMPKITVSNVSNEAGTEGTRIARGTFNFSFPDDGSNNSVKFTPNSSNKHDQIDVSAGPLLFDNGEKFDIADHTLTLGTLYSASNAAATTFNIYFDPDASETQFQIVLQNGFDAVKDHNTTLIGWARADSDPAGIVEFLIGINPDGQSLGLSTEIHSPKNSVSVDSGGLTIREGDETDSFLNFTKLVSTTDTNVLKMFVADASTFNGNTELGGETSSEPTVNMQMFLPNSNSTMTIGSLGNFVLRPHANDAILGTTARGWNTFYTENIYSTSGNIKFKSGIETATGITFGDGSTGGIIDIRTENSAPTTTTQTVGGRIYVKSDSKLYFKSHGDGSSTDGTEYDLTGGGGGAGSTALDDITTGDAASTLATSAGNITIDAQGNDTDIIFKGTDGGSDTDFLTLDGSAAGAATFNSVLLGADGTNSVPTFSFSGDPNTGVYKYSSDALGLTAGGTMRMYVDSTGVVVGSGKLRFTNILTSNSTGEWGVFRYANNPSSYSGNVPNGSTDVLAFSTSQGNASPSRVNADSAFWIMWSDTTNNRLHFEPVVDFVDGGSNNSNLAYIGYNANIAAIYSFYQYAGSGSAAAPTHSFTSDTDTGMYNHTTNQIGFTTGGSVRARFYSGGLVLDTLGTTSGTDLVVDGSNVVHAKTSSRKYKRNIVDIVLDSNKLYDLRPVDFEWNEKSATEGKKDIGLIAEEVAEILPEIVNYNNDKTPKSISYDKLSVILLMEIKKLKEEINKLKEG